MTVKLDRAVGPAVTVPARHVLHKPGRTEPSTVVGLRFAKPTVQRTDFNDTRYLEAYELADAATVQPAFRG